MTHGKVKDATKDLADNAKEAGRETLKAVQSEAAQTAKQVGSAVKDAASSRAEAGKDMVSDQGKAFAAKLRDQANSDADTLQARVLNTIADGVSDVSDDLRGRSLESILEKTEQFARKHPGAFVAGAAVAGFALTRFARATARPSNDTEVTGFQGSTSGSDRQTTPPAVDDDVSNRNGLAETNTALPGRGAVPVQS